MGGAGRYLMESQGSTANGFATNNSTMVDPMDNSMAGQPGVKGRRYVSTYNNDNVDLTKFDLSKSKEFGVEIPSNPPPRRKMPVTPKGEQPLPERPLDDTLAYESRLIYPDGHSTEIGSNNQEVAARANAPPHSPIVKKPEHNPMGPPKDQQLQDASSMSNGESYNPGAGMDVSFGEQTQDLIAAMRGDGTLGGMGGTIGADGSLNTDRSLDIDALYRINMSKLKDLQDFEDLSMNTDRLDDFVLQFQKNADGAQEGNLQEVSLNTDTRWVVKA
jgi:hypothetical protein